MDRLLDERERRCLKRLATGSKRARLDRDRGVYVIEERPLQPEVWPRGVVDGLRERGFVERVDVGEAESTETQLALTLNGVYALRGPP